MASYVTRVVYKTAWNEWLAECSCRWVGSYLPRETQAWDELAAHVASHNA